jgi:hypothetical protein
MIEDSGGRSPDVSKAVVLLPAIAFDDLLRDENSGVADGAAARLSIRGVAFERSGDRPGNQKPTKRRDA